MRQRCGAACWGLFWEKKKFTVTAVFEFDPIVYLFEAFV